MRIWASLLICASLSGVPKCAAQPINCMVNPSSAPPGVRAEGLAELVGDVLIRCTGGDPTPAGQPVPVHDIYAQLSAPIANYAPAGGATDAYLLVDDPQPGMQSLRQPGDPALMGVCGGGSCGGVQYGNPTGPGNAGQQVRNVFQGRATGKNTVVWLGIPIDPPGSVGQRIMRIRNVRGRAADSTEAFIRMTLSAPGLGLVDVSTPVGQVAPGLNHLFQSSTFASATRVPNAAGLNQCQPLNPNLPAGTPGGPTFSVQFIEGFAQSFKPRDANGGTQSNPFPSAPDQNVPTTAYFSESGFFATNLNDRAGRALHGTRLSALFTGVPNGVNLFVSRGQSTGSSTGCLAVAVAECIGEGKEATSTNGLVPVPTANGAGRACWEVLRANSGGVDSCRFDAYLSYGNIANTSTPSLGVIAAKLSLAPDSGVPPSRKEKLEALPMFSQPADPLAFNRDRYAAAHFMHCGPAQPESFRLLRPSAFASGELRGDGASGSVTTNVFLYSDVMARSVTVSPVIRSGSQARGATAQWLTANPSQTATPLTISISANPAGLAPGTYLGGVRLESPGSPPLLNEIPVQLVVPGAGPLISPNGIVGAADYHSGGLTAGQAITIFGSGYGPEQLAGLALDSSGRVSTSLAGVRILFDGSPAPLIYAARGQVSAFVPFGVASRAATEIQIEANGVRSLSAFRQVLPAFPSLFTADSSGSGQGAILNENGSINSAANPAAVNQVVVLFGTGAGQTNPVGQDGNLASAPLPELLSSVRVLIGGVEATVLYAGPAPGLAEGVLQVNARVPANAPRGPSVDVAILSAGFRSQPGVTLAIGE